MPTGVNRQHMPVRGGGGIPHERGGDVRFLL